MKADVWDARYASLMRRIAEKIEEQRKACGGVGRGMVELTRAIFALRKDLDALKPGNMARLRRITERWGYTLDESRGSWRERGRSV